MAYFVSTAAGKMAGPLGAGAAVGLASASFGAAGAAGAAAAGVAVASAPHWALRKSFHFCPFRVPAVLAA